MPFYLTLTAIALVWTSSAYAGIEATANCLQGKVQSRQCKVMIDNYWQVEEAISRVAKSQGLDPLLVKALVAVESGYNHRAISEKGARGLTQVMPATGELMGVNAVYLFEPELNLTAGTRYLLAQWKTFRDWPLALAAYNAGPQAVIRYQGIPPYVETQNYVASVLWLYGQFKHPSKNSPSLKLVGAPKHTNEIVVYAQNTQ